MLLDFGAGGAAFFSSAFGAAGAAAAGAASPPAVQVGQVVQAGCGQQHEVGWQQAGLQQARRLQKQPWQRRLQAQLSWQALQRLQRLNKPPQWQLLLQPSHDEQPLQP